MKSAYLVIAHGSRDKQANEAFNQFIENLRKKSPDRIVQQAFLELARPDIPEAIEECVKKGAEELFVIPLMLFPGRHVKEDIPRFIQEAKAKHPALDFQYSGPLSDDPVMLDVLDRRLQSLKGSQ